MAGTLYRLEFKNVEDTLVRVDILDTSSDPDESPEIISLDPAGTPLKISTIDNDENKFTPIKSQQAIITFLSNTQTSLETFADGPDDRFSVTVIYGPTVIFKGFLSLEDNQEAFLPPRNEVVLTATDKLGALKDIDLVDADGENPQGKYTLGRIAAFCLQKTGLELRLNIMHNLKHGSGQEAMLATFNDSPNQIIVSNANGSFFYPGQVLTISDTVSNNGTFTVTDVAIGIVSIIAIDEALTDEIEVTATFTDVTNDKHFYETFIDAKTFEKEIGVSENCYMVLEKILGYDCFLTQYKGAWWIMRADEFDSFRMYVAQYDEDGLYENIYEELSLNKSIGFSQTHWLSQEATLVLPTRPIDFAKLIYNFEYPKEIVCNQDFERGDFIEDKPAEQNEEGVTQQVKAYGFECWESLSRLGGGATNTWGNYEQPQIAGAELYVKKFYYNNAETLREMVIIGAPGTGAGAPYIKSQPVVVHVKDKINLSVSLYYTNIGGSTGYLNSPVMVGLFGNSGAQYWWVAGDITNPNLVPTWEETGVGINLPHWYLGANLEDDPQTLSNESPPVPESGLIYVFLINQYGNEIQAHYSQLNVSILPFINGAYQNYEGRYHKVERDADGYMAKVEDEVFISDAERALFKGALFYLNDSDYHLTRHWYPANRYSLGYPTDDTYIQPFGWHQAFSVWNQYRLANRIFQFQFQGFGNDIPSLVHKYAITDISSHSLNRSFLMLTCEKDLFLCEMTGTCEQVFHSVEGKDYDSDHEFKYIS